LTENERIATSVIIPALNEERVIGQCLESLCRLDFPREEFEVILVDNGSTDRTIEIAREFSARLNLTILQKRDAKISGLRNFGVSKARGAILAFLDADCLVSRDWLKNAGPLLDRVEVGVAGAHYRIPDNSRWVARAWYGGLETEKQGELAWVPSGDLLMKRSVFERIGGFDESIQTNEDCELCGRVRAAGLRVIGDPSIAVTHLGTPQTLFGFYRAIRWHATDGFRVFLRELPKISNPRPLFFGFYNLLCVVGVAAGVVLAAMQKGFGVLIVSLFALILPSFLLSLRVAARRRKWSYLLPLTVIHIVFGLARGFCLLEFRNLR